LFRGTVSQKRGRSEVIARRCFGVAEKERG